MKRSPERTLQRLAFSLGAVFFTMQVGQGHAFAAGTAPNTVIQNTATASYNDGNGNSYTTNSNTVSTTVQNAPSLSVAPPTAQNVAPGQIVVDTYTLTNTGNASGTFAIPTGTPATVGANGTLAGYVIAGTTCTAAAQCNITQANTALAGVSVLPGITIAIGVEYTVSITAKAGNTIPTTLTANITQPTSGAAPAATSANVTATQTDTVSADARLDLQKAASTPPTAAADITFTITGNNGGSFAATDLKSVQSLLGTAAPGVVVTDLIPQFGGKPLNLDTASPPSVALNGAGTGTTATLYYSTSPTGAAGSWSTTYVAGDYFIAAFLSGGTGGVELPSKPGNSAGAGSVSVPELTFVFSTFQPSGTGAANSGSISNIANALIGGNPGATGVTPIMGPFAGSGEADSANPTTPIGGAVTNQTSTPGTVAPGGDSNTVTSAAYATNTVSVGPLNFPNATGSYPAAPNNGTGAATNNNDYTAAGFVCSNGATVNNGTFSCIIPAAGITVPGTYTNSGNAADTLTLSVMAPAGFTAQAFQALGCNASVTSLNNTGCTKGNPITGLVTSGNTGSGTLGSVASATSGNYIVVYLPTTAGTSAVAPFTAIDSVVTVAGTQAGTVSSDTNTTHVDLYPGGPITLTKSQAIVTNYPAGSTGQTAGAPCPGGTITYTVTYLNTAPTSAVAGGTNVGTEPSFAYNALTTVTGPNAFVLTEDGALAPNNWATYTNGLTAAPTTTGTATFTFAYTPTAGTAAGSSKFTATANSAIAAGATGTVVFSAIVK